MEFSSSFLNTLEFKWYIYTIVLTRLQFGRIPVSHFHIIDNLLIAVDAVSKPMLTPFFHFIIFFISIIHWFGLLGFYGISTFIGYLTPNSFLWKYSILFQTIQFSISTQFNCQKHFYFKLFKQLYVTIQLSVNTVLMSKNSSISNNSVKYKHAV